MFKTYLQNATHFKTFFDKTSIYIEYLVSAPLQFFQPKFQTMSNLLFIIAVILIILWLLGYFAFNVGAIIHVLLVIAVIAILIRLIRGRGI